MNGFIFRVGISDAKAVEFIAIVKIAHVFQFETGVQSRGGDLGPLR